MWGLVICWTHSNGAAYSCTSIRPDEAANAIDIVIALFRPDFRVLFALVIG